MFYQQTSIGVGQIKDKTSQSIKILLRKERGFSLYVSIICSKRKVYVSELRKLTHG